jgi:4-amino-4-deoxy-L-arabinose transferase-like glycosyltransferase
VVAVALVVALHLAVVLLGIYVAPLGFDETYVAQAPWNLVQGNGYATFDCCDTGGLRPFDPLISTGPVVLLPIAASFLIFGIGIVQLRWMMVPFYALLVIAAWAFGFKIAGRWVGLLSAVAVLALNLRYDFPQTVVWGVTDGLGEIPAAAFLLLAVLLLPRTRTGAGIAVGLAALCKLVALIAVPAFVVAIVLLPALVGWRAKVRAVVVFGALVALPSILWEVVKFISVGWPAYIDVVKNYLFFVMGSGSGIETRGDPSNIGSRAINMLEVWFVPWQLGMLVLLALGALGILGFRRRRALLANPDSRTELTTMSIAALGTIVLFLIWWVAISSSFFTRHAFPGLLLIAPVLAAFGAAGLGGLLTSSRRWLTAGGVVVLIGWVAVGLWQTGSHVVQAASAPTYTREDQERVAAIVRTDFPDGVQHIGYFFNPELQLLSRVESLPFPTGAGPLVLSPQMADIAPDLFQRARALCIDTVYEAAGFVICTVETAGAEPLTTD